ncbi:protein daughter of sevenless [Nilaparvata lugens]|uniref:protein daughter of sevenless n=1 Tax=Nilaparvata lugens TaxID=108931 RepID=UPI00193EAD27|nr:protein daughter of sevenless [Nilaparvata lugens]
MSNRSDSLEVVHEGWLTKSPPTKRIWRARWRRRWFVLRHSGELPGQYFLYYYTDRNCRKLKGQIDLDQCEQVDAGLRFENRKQKYQYMFVVKTPKRTYYLATETELEMNKWVDCICQVCGLRAFLNEENNCYEYGGHEQEDEPSIAEESSQNAESPPVSPTSTASGPYIPLNECFTGKLPLANGDEFYDAPRKLQPPPNLELRVSESSTPPLQSPVTDAESVFTDEEWVNNTQMKPPVNWKTFPKPSDSSLEGDVVPRSATLATVAKRFTRVLTEDEVVGVLPVAPPRPPKPSHLSPPDPNDHNYLNLENCVEVGEQVGGGVTDDMYDFPRTHNVQVDGSLQNAPVAQKRNCYTNYSTNKSNGGTVFRYDFDHHHQPQSLDASEPVSPNVSESSSTAAAQYSNLPSPLTPSLPTPPPGGGNGGFVVPPPFVNRGLKPQRRNRSGSVTSNDGPSPGVVGGVTPGGAGVVGPPNVDRALKPTPVARKKYDVHLDEGSSPGALVLCAPPGGRRNSAVANKSTTVVANKSTMLPTTTAVGNKSAVLPTSTAVGNKSVVLSTGTVVAIGDYGSLKVGGSRGGSGRAAPTPSPPVAGLMLHLLQPRRHSDTSEPDLRNSDHEMLQMYKQGDLWLSSNPHLIGSKRWDEIEYLDLDLNSADYSGTGTANRKAGPGMTSQVAPSTPFTPTVYKTVDFLKTEAFNRTRQSVEAERKHL